MTSFFRRALVGLVLGAAWLCCPYTMAGVSTEIVLESFADGLTGALGLKPAPDGSGRLFAVEQAGRIRILDAEGNLAAQPLIDISNRVACCGERGLLDIAFHPEFAVNGRFFLHYSAGNVRPPDTAPGDTVVAEFRISDDPNRAEPEPIRTLLTVAQDFGNHNGGQMEFGPDGYLYLALGDGGRANDPCNRAQTLDPDNIDTGGDCKASPSAALLGKILRLDVDAKTAPGTNNLCGAADDGSANYAIPTENPFFDQADRCGEVLMYGLRNPWRFSFDRDTGDLWIGDVGQDVWEEIDLLPAPLIGGENLGWKPCEGRFARGSTSFPCPLDGAVEPVLEYRHPGGRCSVTGGFRYRGPVSGLRGGYLFGDFCSGEIWLARPGTAGWTESLLEDIADFSLRAFGEDAVGNVYVVTGNSILRFDGPAEVVFEDGFEG